MTTKYNNVYIDDTYTICGNYENDGPLSKYFDKKYEKDFTTDFVSLEIIESLKELILNGAGGLKCPKCGANLATKIERMYDLEDNLVLHPKAHCTKCVFQIH